MTPSAELPHDVPFREAVRVWLRIALLSFGGPAGQIAVMHRILVEEKRWIGENRFLHALNYCMLLPGPEAQQLATYIGWLLHGVRGGIAVRPHADAGRTRRQGQRRLRGAGAAHGCTAARVNCAVQYGRGDALRK